MVGQAADGLAVADGRARGATALGTVRRQQADMYALARTMAELAGEPSVEGVLRLATEALVDRFGGVVSRAWILDEAGEALRLRARAGGDDERDAPLRRVPLGELRIGLVAETQQAYLTNRFSRDPRAADPRRLAAEGLTAFAGWPLVAGGRLLGALSFLARRAIPSARFALLGTLAEATALGLERARLYEAERAARTRLRALHDVDLTLARGDEGGDDDLDRLLRRVVEVARGLLEASGGTLSLWDPAAGGLRVRAWVGMGEPPPATFLLGGDGASGQAFRERRPVIANAYQEWGEALEVVRQRGIRAVAVAPLLAGGEVIGTLSVGTVEAHRYTEEDAELLQLFALRAAQAIDAARSHDRTRRDAATKAVLLEEIHHRVRNNLAMVGTLLELERHRRPPPTLEEALARIGRRVQGIAAVHTLLGEQAFHAVDFRAVARELCRATPSDGASGRVVRCRMSARAVELTAKAATALALALNELLTNALKHGRGTVRVSLRESKGDVCLRVVDGDGGGRRGPPAGPEDDAPRGMGLRLVRTLVERELEGSLRFERGARGALAEVCFPRDGDRGEAS
jgi:two-component sensor histidine kinase